MDRTGLRIQLVVNQDIRRKLSQLGVSQHDHCGRFALSPFEVEICDGYKGELSARGQSDLSVTCVYFAPTQPAGIDRGNWIQTDPKKGWWTILRLYSPLESFFDKSWRPGEIELVK